MANLKTSAQTSTTAQHRRLAIAARDLGWSREQLRDTLNVTSLKELSSYQASQAITKLTGDELPNPPGEKPSVYPHKAKTPGITRMISCDQVSQIHRLALAYFDGHRESAKAWLYKNFRVYSADRLGTAKRGGEVIAALKRMIARQDATH